MHTHSTIGIGFPTYDGPGIPFLLALACSEAKKSWMGQVGKGIESSEEVTTLVLPEMITKKQQEILQITDAYAEN